MQMRARGATRSWLQHASTGRQEEMGSGHSQRSHSQSHSCIPDSCPLGLSGRILRGCYQLAHC